MKRRRNWTHGIYTKTPSYKEIWKEKSNQNHKEDQICEEYVDDQNNAIQIGEKVHNDDVIKKISVDKIIAHQVKEEIDSFSIVTEKISIYQNMDEENEKKEKYMNL